MTKLAGILISLVARVLIALPAFVVIVCVAACVGMIEMLGSHPLRSNVVDSSSSRGLT